MTPSIHSFAIIGERKAHHDVLPDWVSDDSKAYRAGDRLVVEFERGGESREEAVESAIGDMTRCGLRIVRVDS